MLTTLSFSHLELGGQEVYYCFKGTGIMVDCTERLRLKQDVIASVNAVYDAKRDCDIARAARATDIDARIFALGLARKKGRAAQRAMERHIAEHHCVPEASLGLKSL
jgi:hypothetical protein